MLIHKVVVARIVEPIIIETTEFDQQEPIVVRVGEAGSSAVMTAIIVVAPDIVSGGVV